MTDMRERQISDLLALRDGELAPAAAAEVLARPGAPALRDELGRLRDALRSLPDPVPDAVRWARIRDTGRARAPAAGRPGGAVLRFPGRFVPYAAAAGLVLALGAGLLAVNTVRQSSTAGGAPGRASDTTVQEDPTLRVLYERSKRLEPLLVSADRRDPTEQALRLRIADLDSQIVGGPEAGLNRQQAERLWGQRVALLESLAEVRRARATLQPAVY